MNFNTDNLNRIGGGNKTRGSSVSAMRLRGWEKETEIFVTIVLKADSGGLFLGVTAPPSLSHPLSALCSLCTPLEHFNY